MTGRILKPGTLVVLEGLDKTGKSTQAALLKRELDPATTEHVHMPRGFSHFTATTYALLEDDACRPSSGVARQLAHLACHAESMPRIVELLRDKAVLLDRWWWSTIAYGWYSGDIPEGGITKQAFMNVVQNVWSPLTASVIFVFDEPYEDDSNNSRPIRNGYRELASEAQALAARVPVAGVAEVTAFMLAELERRDLTIAAN
ncbi:hypothetical protein [Cellulomonas sp. ES6]|uniref:hypothetical protein n=1 Tax=Cellulomonas sp. ES6 TaxID=3039384 RepID=UPI0024B7F106|nr:hypothetical protein [Cellulomonas sp. ES6]WHP18934.1 hypothetical protein P9841_07410 [Cellulomonas sp. ES6]